ncbi:MAG TPA: RsfA family transcriptional regulator [Pseudogracilibacillus sp.]|nr:RsfA family transcriptional regulator [Pseudogracilibacillus sp.]
MAKVRQDAWSHEDDLLLAETVLRHIREGSTQLNAFEEVGDILNRTSAACGFRWNAEVRNKYVEAIELAKRQRKEKKRAEAKQMKQKTKAEKTRTITTKQDESYQDVVDETLTLQKVISYLQTLQLRDDETYASQQKVYRLEEEKRSLQAKVDSLEQELSTTGKKLKTMEEDYKMFIQIMERARKMTVLDESGAYKSPVFKMDKNGNLEQFIQDAT